MHGRAGGNRQAIGRSAAPDSILNRLSGVPSISNWRDNKFYVPPLGVGRLFPAMPAPPPPEFPARLNLSALLHPTVSTRPPRRKRAEVKGGGRRGGLLQQRQIAARRFRLLLDQLNGSRWRYGRAPSFENWWASSNRIAYAICTLQRCRASMFPFFFFNLVSIFRVREN